MDSTCTSLRKIFINQAHDAFRVTVHRVGQTRRGRSMIEKAPRRSILESPRHPDRESLPCFMFDFVACSSWPSKKSTDLMETHSHAPNLSCVPLHPPFLFSMRSQYNVEFFCRRCTISAIYSKIIIVCLRKRIFLSELHTCFQISGAYSNRW